jgi:putative DNA primase/helicase
VSAQLSAAEIHSRLAGGGWRPVLIQLGVPEEFLRGPRKQGPCLFCGGHDRYVFDDRHGRGDYFCRNPDCGPGDGFDLLVKLHRWTFSEAIQQIAKAIGLNPSELLGKRGGDRRSERARENQGNNITLKERGTTADYTLARLRRDLWRHALPISGDALEYLEARRCRLPPSDGHLRWLPKLHHPGGYVGPALIALVTDAVTGEPISIHRTWITSTGKKAAVDPARMLLKGCRKRGGIIRLWPDSDVTDGLAIAEGIETALALANAYQPVWSAIDAGNLAALPIIPGIEALTIAADHDDAGLKAAALLGQRWANAGRDVLIATPEVEGLDVADLVAA